MTRIAVVIPTWQPDRALRVIDNLREYAKDGGAEVEYIISTNRDAAWASYLQDTLPDQKFFIHSERMGAVQAMWGGAQKIIAESAPDIIVFCHDDIEVYENWTLQLLMAFSMNGKGRQPLNIGLIGLHGAKGLGSDDIYRTPYQLQQLARFNPMSNMIDAERHGKRVTLFTEVATIDGFFMAFSAQAYKDMGGWEACLRDGIPYHMYDSWAAMRMRELGYSVYMAPISCKHSGGGTEVSMAGEYEAWARANGFKDIDDVHVQGHHSFYNRFRGQLPVRIR